MNFRRLVIALTLLLSAAAVHALPPVYTLQTGVGNDDVGGDAEGFFYLAGAVLVSRGLSKKSMIDLEGELTTIDFPDNADRSGEELFLQATYSFTPRAGFRVPTYSVGLRQVEEMLSDSDGDTSTTSLILSLSYRVDDRSNLHGGFKFDAEDALEDSDTTGVFVNYDYRYSPRVILYTTLNLADQDIDSGGAAVSGSPAFAAREFVSGHHTAGEGGANAVSSSDNTYLTLGATWALTSANSLDMSVSHQQYDTDAGEVSGNIVSVDFFHRF